MGNIKFNEKELKRLKCTDEEISLILEYQKKLPILLEDNNSWINSRILHEQLKVTLDYSTWFKNQIESLELQENIDFKPLLFKKEQDINVTHGGTNRIDYYIRILTAKEIAMIAGNKGGRTSEELRNNSKLARKYFILMEDIIKRNEEWWSTRMPQRKNYKPMCDALSEKLYELCGRYGDKYDFSREANILNIISTGVKAQDIKLYLSVHKNELTRDSLENEYNEKIAFLQDQNILLINTDMKISDRVKFLINFFDTKYPSAKPLMDYKTREDMLSARNDLLNSLNK